MTDFTQGLMNEVYGKWQELEKEGKKYDKHQVIDEFFTEVHRGAVMFGNLNYQVENGGFSQWFLNGYADEDFDYLYNYIQKGYEEGLSSFTILKEIFNRIIALGDEPEVTWEEYECEYCDGEGYIESDEDEEEDEECPDCCGSGVYEDEDDYEHTQYWGKVSENDEVFYSIGVDNLFKDVEKLIEIVRDNPIEMKPIPEAPEPERPTCKLIGTDGNVFFIIAKVKRCLKDAGKKEEAEKFAEEAMNSNSYDDVLCLTMKYVDVV